MRTPTAHLGVSPQPRQTQLQKSGLRAGQAGPWRPGRGAQDRARCLRWSLPPGPPLPWRCDRICRDAEINPQTCWDEPTRPAPPLTTAPLPPKQAPWSKGTALASCPVPLLSEASAGGTDLQPWSQARPPAADQAPRSGEGQARPLPAPGLHAQTHALPGHQPLGAGPGAECRPLSAPSPHSQSPNGSRHGSLPPHPPTPGTPLSLSPSLVQRPTRGDLDATTSEAPGQCGGLGSGSGFRTGPHTCPHATRLAGAAVLTGPTPPRPSWCLGGGNRCPADGGLKHPPEPEKAAFRLLCPAGILGNGP